MPGNRLRAGIVGAGLMGFWHARAIRRAGGNIAAVVDPDRVAATRLATRLGAAGFATLEEMLRQVGLDVVHVCSPSSTHREIASAAIASGLHAIVEKPLAPNVAQTKDLLERAASSGVLLCPVHQFIFQDGALRARRLLAGIGKLLYMTATFCSAGAVGLSPEQVDGVVRDILPHPLSLMQTFLPGGICGQWTTVRSLPGEFHAVSEYSGTDLSILISMNGRPTECSFALRGTEGTIYLDLFHGFAFVDPGQVSKPKKILHPFALALRQAGSAGVNLIRRSARWEAAYPGLRCLVRSFYQAVRGGGALPIAPEDVVAVAQARDWLIDGMRLARSHQPSPSLQAV